MGDGQGETRWRCVHFRGLFMEGARWDQDTKSLNDSRPKQLLYTQMCTIHMSPVKDRVAPTGRVWPLSRVQGSLEARNALDYRPLDQLCPLD